MFINAKPVDISDNRGNTVWIRGKMDRGAKADLSAEYIKRGGVSQWAYDLALLYANVLRWQGPDFEDEKGRPFPVTKTRIDSLDPDEPFWGKVLDKIRELNRPRELEVTPEEAEKDPTPAAAST